MQLWAAFVLGLAGSLHCAGMCGPLAAALPGALNSRSAFLLGRLCYNAGRMTTYVALGFALGLLGSLVSLGGYQRWLSLVAGVTVLAALAAGHIGIRFHGFSRGVEFLKRRWSAVSRSNSPGALWTLGALNGLLPCGLVYVALAAALTAGGTVRSAACMAMFGLGTLPMMLAASVVGPRLLFATRLRFQAVVPWVVACAGLLLVLRGLALGIPWISPAVGAGGSCAVCH